MSLSFAIETKKIESDTLKGMILLVQELFS